MSTIIKAACAITGTDYELVRNANYYDRSNVIAKALILLLTATLGMVAWSALFSTFLSGRLTIIATTIVVAMIFLLDRHLMATALSIPASVANLMAEQSPPPVESDGWSQRLVRTLRIDVLIALVTRLAYALILATMTSFGLSIYLYQDTIADMQAQELASANQTLITEYEKRGQTMRDALRDSKAEHGRQSESLSSAKSTMAELLDQREAAVAEMEHFAIEMGRQNHGWGGRTKGQGVEYFEAERQRDRAANTVARLDQRIGTQEATVSLIEENINELSSKISQETNNLSEFEAGMMAAAQADPRWRNRQQSPLAAMISLEKIFRDDEYGKIAKRTHQGVLSPLIALELTPLLMSIVFRAPTVYELSYQERLRNEISRVQLNANLQRRADEAAATKEIPTITVGVGEEGPSDGQGGADNVVWIKTRTDSRPLFDLGEDLDNSKNASATRGWPPGRGPDNSA